MKPIVIYTQPLCGFCVRAKRLLAAKSASFTEIDTSRGPGKRAEMIQRANGARTAPQIFIGDVHVGGCDELHALERSGRLDALLAE